MLDLESLSYDGIYSLGFKDLSLEENAVDLIKDGAFAGYINTRDFSEEMELNDEHTHFESDISPEGPCFVTAEYSPTGTPLLLAAFEVSGTVAAYSVEELDISYDENTKNPDTGVSSGSTTAPLAAAASLMLVMAGKKRK